MNAFWASENFEAFIVFRSSQPRDLAAKTLAKNGPVFRSQIIMDNLGSHKSPSVPQMIREAGARLWYLPPYSPDLNPIEQVFAKIKHWMTSPRRGPSTPPAITLGASPGPSSQTSAPTTSSTKDTLPSKHETL
ncbi:transposase [Rhodopseudomonas palustris]|nr:transposase [Rhodopseudomonas palustris]